MPLIVDIPPKSQLPEGGSPAGDAAYLAWRDAYLERASELLWARHWHDAPHYGVPAGWQLDAYLFDALRGSLPLFGRDSDPVTYSHRLRFLAVALRTRRRAVLTASARCLELHRDGARRSQ
jgi:hypothetical protein